MVALRRLMMFGLTGPKGRLTRLAALLAAVLVVGLLVAFALSAAAVPWSDGPVIILIGGRSATSARAAGRAHAQRAVYP